MYTLILAGVSSPIYERINGARSRAPIPGFDSPKRIEQSFPSAAVIASRVHASVVLFEADSTDDVILRQLREFRKACPTTALAGILPTYSLRAADVARLLQCGVDCFIDEPALSRQGSVRGLLRRAAHALVCRKVLQFVHSNLGAPGARAAIPTLVELFGDAMLALSPIASDGPPSRRRTKGDRREHGSHSTFATPLRLLVLTFLVELLELPVSKAYALAGFPSDEDARKLLSRRSGVGSRKLSDPVAMKECRMALVHQLKAFLDRRDAARSESAGRGTGNGERGTGNGERRTEPP